MEKLSLSGILFVALGVLGILFDVGYQLVDAWDFIPESVGDILFAISGILSTMGIREIMLKSKANIISKVVDFKSETFWGSTLAFLTPALVDPVGIDSDTLRYVLQGAGILFGVLGLGNAGKRGVFAE